MVSINCDREKLSGCQGIMPPELMDMNEIIYACIGKDGISRQLLRKEIDMALKFLDRSLSHMKYLS